MDPTYTTRQFREYLQFSYPAATLLVFLIGFITNSVLIAKSSQNGGAVRCGLEEKPLSKGLRSTIHKIADAQKHQFSSSARYAFVWLVVGVLVTLVADVSVHISHAIAGHEERWWCGQATVIYVVGSFFSHVIIFLSLLDTNPAPTFAQFIPWSMTIPFELAIVATSLSIYTNTHHDPIVGNAFGGPLRERITKWELLEVISGVIRLLFLVFLVALYVLHFVRANSAEGSREDSPMEQIGLLDSETKAGAENNEGDDAPEKPTTAPNTWWQYLSGYSVLFPYLWPSKSRRLQIIVIICFGLLILQRIVNVLVPYQVGVITEALSIEGNNIHLPWLQICLYIIYRWLQGSQGLLESLRSYLWIPISQYAYMETSTASFEHVHGLSLDFHLNKKIGEVLYALNKGSDSVNTFLEQVTFQVVPMVIDLGVAVGYFLIAFDAYYGLVVAIVTFFYLYVTVRIAQWRAEMRRKQVNAHRQENAIKNDSLSSYETVKHFNAELLEHTRYRTAVSTFQSAEYHSLYAQSFMTAAQNTVFTLGLLLTCFIAAYQVSIGQRPVGQFMTLLTYMAQLQTPLSYFGTFYRYIQTAMINSERLLELLRERASVVDRVSARPMDACQGRITFEDIGFAYDARKHKNALNGLSFHCEPGTITALVGESGGGKSTIFRLLFRFYNPQTGRILVDNNDVQDITIASLREHIAIVPQDTSLFNESLLYNLRYASPSATDEDIHNACRAACIHDKIMTFPEAYETKVGDRGLRLSGGEKQRVAIAQTILKNPQIILLDEATAALDSETEGHVQEALGNLAKGRTVIMIAHRLSTVTEANQILVLHEGRVVERGTHGELLGLGGRYMGMWRRQSRQGAGEELRRRNPQQRLL
ncbi:uncharacterized protein ACHE_10470S [Aspergillus chevalieri]|uniref:Heavy metal tolerance protein n=1 Tax=Aspergillus chevalieri TaxID=182096 RepID=A0A7R7VE03_ASPCH|nr:uncharacterized protein ACHE_10470S [Aspergillus chevalieri]BCR83068.1 hypothetical protein ACHE_10470S [Aspergillus chevalieri]